MTRPVVIVCGGRDFHDRELVYRTLDAVNPLLVVHGACGVDADFPRWDKMKGADLLADQWAAGRGVACERVPAHWTRWPRSGGPKRNAEMLKRFKPNLVVAFPGDRGTANMIALARAAGVSVREIAS